MSTITKRQIIHVGYDSSEPEPDHTHIETLVRIDEHHIAGMRLGRHIEHDARSRQHAVKFDLADILSLKSVHHQRESGPLDQGEVGSCTGNAEVGILMSQPLWYPGLALTEKDALELYHEATKLDRIPGTYPPNDTGSSGLAVMKAAVKAGFIDAYKHAFSIAAALKALQSVPFIGGNPWYDSFDSPDKNGVISIQEGAVIRGGHEWAFNGVTLEFNHDGSIDEENSLYDCWNSWGTSFGIGGAFKMSVATHRILMMKEYGDVTVPVPKTPKLLEG